jgi:hypothetical protein
MIGDCIVQFAIGTALVRNFQRFELGGNQFLKDGVPLLFELSAGEELSIDYANFRVKYRRVASFANGLIDLPTFPREFGGVKMRSIFGKK